MRGCYLIAFALCFAFPTLAGEPDINAIVRQHILPGYQSLSDAATELEKAASENCATENTALQEAFHNAFDAWVRVSHLRFGPSEDEDRAFALAFWPDPRSATPKALTALMAEQDPIVFTETGFSTVSVAARGFYALEFLLFDPQFASNESADYHCALTQAVASDISRNADAILSGWQNGYSDLISRPENDTYRSSAEAVKQVFTALITGLEFTSQARIGRPLGTFERPRPMRAEARRSGRSLRHVVLSLAATRELAAQISMNDPQVDAAFSRAIKRANALDDPVFAGVSGPASRLRVEVLQQDLDTILQLLVENVGPSLGISAGFNALDGD